MTFSRKFIPSLFTILNAFCGFVSIIHSSQNDFVNASLFIVYAAMFDMFDGIVARMLHSSSDFGVELDSLSDVISFGAAPSFLIYSIYFHKLDGIGLAISSLMMAFSAIRLARFNVELVGYEKDRFYGVPTPVSALTIVSYILLYHNNLFNEKFSEITIFILAIGLPVLMVSKFSYPVLPKINKQNILKNKLVFSVLFIVIIISALSKGVFVFPFLIIYIFSGIFKTLFGFKTKKLKK